MAPVTSHWRVPVRSGPRGRREHPLGRLRALGVSPALVVGVRVGVVGALGSNAEIVSSGRGVVAHWGRAPPLDDGRGEVLSVGNRRQHVPGRRGHGARVVKVREGVLEKPCRVLGRVIRGGRPQVEEVPVDVRLLGAGAGGRRGDRLGLLRGGSPLAVLRHFSLCVFLPTGPLPFLAQRAPRLTKRRDDGGGERGEGRAVGLRSYRATSQPLSTLTGALVAPARPISRHNLSQLSRFLLRVARSLVRSCSGNRLLRFEKKKRAKWIGRSVGRQREVSLAGAGGPGAQ